ncbi:MAG: hypothetical protein EOM49_03545 [Epsilonproteobacteria bacterium]|nr:hypothetical protein [Campylobacterota bacterium]
MCIDGDVLELDFDMDLEEIKALTLFVKDRLAYIEEIVIFPSKEGLPTSSSLWALLWCLKQEKPSLKIDAIDKIPLDLGVFGTLYWISHE